MRGLERRTKLVVDPIDPGGRSRARSHCRFVLPLIHFILESLIYSVPLFLKRRCDRTLGTLASPRVRPAGSPRPGPVRHACPMDRN